MAAESVDKYYIEACALIPAADLYEPCHESTAMLLGQMIAPMYPVMSGSVRTILVGSSGIVVCRRKFAKDRLERCMRMFKKFRLRSSLQRSLCAWIALGSLVVCPADSFGQSGAQIVAGSTYAVTGVLDNDVLYIRSEANPSGAVVGTVPPKAGGIVASGAIARRGAAIWAEVYYQGGTGWVNSRYLIEDASTPRNSLELFKAGVSIRYLDPDVERPKDFAGSTPQHPNRCPYAIGSYFEEGAFQNNQIEISLSDEMLAHFQRRGFNLKTLCLAITTPMTYDPETGVPIPSVNLGYHLWVLLNVPDCFRRGTPMLDCNMRYHWFWRGRMDRAYSEASAKLDRLIKQKLQAGAVLPHYLVRGSVERFAGSKLTEELFSLSPARGIQFIEISSGFERGYAYRLGTGFTAGDDPEEERRQEGRGGRQMLTKSDMKIAVPWGK